MHAVSIAVSLAGFLIQMGQTPKSPCPCMYYHNVECLIASHALESKHWRNTQQI